MEKCTFSAICSRHLEKKGEWLRENATFTLEPNTVYLQIDSYSADTLLKILMLNSSYDI